MILLFICVCDQHRRTELWSPLFDVRYVIFYIAWNVNCAFMDGPVVMNFSIGLGKAKRDSNTSGRCVESCNKSLTRVIYDPWCKSHLVLVNVHELLNSQYRERALDITHSNNGNFLRVLTQRLYWEIGCFQKIIHLNSLCRYLHNITLYRIVYVRKLAVVIYVRSFIYVLSGYCRYI